MEKLDILGEIIIQKLRDENYELYLNRKNYANSITKEEYTNQSKNPNIDKEYQQINDERFELLNGLSKEQQLLLDKLVLNLLDSTAFNFLREIEENLMQDKSLGLTIEGQKVEEASLNLLSGTLFGEYFLWCEQKSKYGKFQH